MTISIDNKSIKPILRIISVTDSTWDGFMAETARFMAADFFIDALFRGIVPIDIPISRLETGEPLKFPYFPRTNLPSLVKKLKAKVNSYLKADIETNPIYDEIFTVLVYVNNWKLSDDTNYEPSAHIIDDQRLLVVLNRNHVDFDPDWPFMPNAPIPTFRVGIVLTVLLSDFFGWFDYRPQYLYPERVQQILDTYDTRLTIRAFKNSTDSQLERAFLADDLSMITPPYIPDQPTKIISPMRSEKPLLIIV